MKEFVVIKKFSNIHKKLLKIRALFDSLIILVWIYFLAIRCADNRSDKSKYGYSNFMNYIAASKIKLFKFLGRKSRSLKRNGQLQSSHLVKRT